MAFIVEDGTGVENSNALVSVLYADSYFATRGTVGWTGTDTQKQFAIVRATDYFELRFGKRLISSVVSGTQSLSFPRVGLTLVPDKIKRAVCEYALVGLTESLFQTPKAIDDSGNKVLSVSKKLGPLEKTITYSGTSTTPAKVLPQADALLVGYVVSGNAVIR